jgi:pantetheine-phosphate adenylyltransferase
MARIGIFPGTFDPPSLGHLDIIQRSALFCDRLIVAVAVKPEKKSHSLFSVDEKIEMLHLIAGKMPHVEIISFHGLIVDFARERKAHFLLRGLRAFSDFEYEFQMALANRRLSGIETLFLMADERLSQTSSSLIREIAYFGGPLHDFVPKEIVSIIRKKISKNE